MITIDIYDGPPKAPENHYEQYTVRFTTPSRCIQIAHICACGPETLPVFLETDTMGNISILCSQCYPYFEEDD